MTSSPLARRLATATVATLAALALSGCSILMNVLNGGESDVFTLEVGDCFNDGDGTVGEVSSVPIVDCSEPHDNEVYAAVYFEDGDFPGAAEVDEFAGNACYDAYEDFVGIAYEDSLLNFGTFYPSAQSWAAGDREVLCLISAFNDDGSIKKVTGSLKNSKE
jgi:hypothetical protein